MPRSRKSKVIDQRVTTAQAVRDVFLGALNKGQFIPALIAFVFLFMVWRMPSEDVSRLVFQILADIENAKLLGYILFGGSAAGWAIHVKLQRRVIHNEMARISTERNELQAEALNAQIESSAPKQLPPPEEDEI